MKGKHINALLLLVVLICTAALSACQKIGSEHEQEYKSTFSLSASYITAPCFETVELTAYDNDGNAIEPNWRVLNSDIAAVEGGVITGLSVGRTSVIAEINGEKKACTVDITKHRQIAAIIIPETMQLKCKSAYVLNPVTVFDGSEIEIAGYTYISSDESIIEVSQNGVITAKDCGEARVSVQTQFYGITIVEAVQITVIEDIDLEIGESSLAFIYGTDAGRQILARLYIEGALQSQPLPALVWETDNASTAMVDQSGTITVKGKGDAVITVSYPAQYSTVRAYIRVKVRSPLKRVATDYLFETDNGGLSKLKEKLSFADGENIENITDITNSAMPVKLRYDADADTVTNKHDMKLGAVVWHVMTNYGEYEAEFTAVTRAISSIEDWPAGYGTGNVPTNSPRSGHTDITRNGYYVLTSDIYVNPDGGAGYNQLYSLADAQAPFNGTFDGQGHEIKNQFIRIGCGLFGDIGTNGTVKNLAVTGTRIANHVGGVIAMEVSGIIENVYVSLGGTPAQRLYDPIQKTSGGGLIARSVKAGGIVRNVIADLGDIRIRHESFDNNVVYPIYSIAFTSLASGATVNGVYVYLNRMYKANGTDLVAANLIKFAFENNGATGSNGLLRDMAGAKSTWFSGWDTKIWELPVGNGAFPVFK